MSTLQVTTANRSAAKRLLNNWHKSTDVRGWALDRLTLEIRRAITEGLITAQGAERALAPPEEYKAEQNDSRNEGKKGDHKTEESGGDNSGSKGESSDDAEGEDGKDGEDGEGNSSSEDGEGKQGEGEQSEGEQGNGEGDSDSEDESDEGEQDEGKDEQAEGENETESEGEDEQRQDNEDEDENDEDEDEFHHHMFKDVLAYIRAGLNVALVGPAGTGKSTIAAQAAAATDREFRCCGAVHSKYDLVGYQDAAGQYHATPLYEAFNEGHLFCFDELDASSPDAVVTFNACTDNQKYFAFPNGQRPKHERFVAIACMNTYGTGATADYVGRYKQDAAAMSRYVRVFIGYDSRLEERIAGVHVDILQRVQGIRKACDELGIRHVASTRMIVQAVAARELGKVSKTKLDRDIFFSGLDEDTTKQIKSALRAQAQA